MFCGRFVVLFFYQSEDRPLGINLASKDLSSESARVETREVTLATERTLEERLADMAGERGLPKWMQEAAQEALKRLEEGVGSESNIEMLEVAQETLAMMANTATWPERLAYIEEELRRALGSPTGREATRISRRPPEH